MKHRTIAVDLAKSVFEIGISEQPGRMEKTHRLGRARLLRFMAKQQRATILMEACGSGSLLGPAIPGTGARSCAAAASLRPAVRVTQQDGSQ